MTISSEMSSANGIDLTAVASAAVSEPETSLKPESAEPPRRRRSSVCDCDGPRDSNCGSFYGPRDSAVGSFYGPRDSNCGSFYGPRDSAVGSFYGPRDSDVGSFYGPRDSNCGSFYGPRDSNCGSFYGPRDSAVGSFYGPRDSAVGSFYGPRDSAVGSSYGPRDSNCGSFYGPRDSELGSFYNSRDSNARNVHDTSAPVPQALPEGGAGSMAAIDQAENSWDAVYAANTAIKTGNFPPNFACRDSDESQLSWVTRGSNDVPVAVVLESPLYSQQGTDALKPVAPGERRPTGDDVAWHQLLGNFKGGVAAPNQQHQAQENGRGCRSEEIVMRIREHRRNSKDAAGDEAEDIHKPAPSGFVDELTMEEEAQAIVAPATRMTITPDGIKYQNTARYASKDVHTVNRSQAVSAQLARQAFNLPSVRNAEHARLRKELRWSHC